jgi:diguanylate cyclase (GGDEF)-like protein/PAS domain S-box-containing protein
MGMQTDKENQTVNRLVSVLADNNSSSHRSTDSAVSRITEKHPVLNNENKNPLYALSADDVGIEHYDKNALSDEIQPDIVVRADKSLGEILDFFRNGQIENIAVTNENNEVTGLITRTSLIFRLLIQMMRLNKLSASLIELSSVKGSRLAQMQAVLTIIDEVFEPEYSIIGLFDKSDSLLELTEQNFYNSPLPKSLQNLTGENLIKLMTNQGLVTRSDNFISACQEANSDDKHVSDIIGIPFKQSANEHGIMVLHQRRDGIPYNAFDVILAKTIATTIERGNLFFSQDSANSNCQANINKLLSAVAHTADTVMITDLVGNIEYVNKAFESSSGYTPAEVIGRNSSILNSGQHKTEYFTNMWEVILAGKSFRDVLVNRNKNGSLYRVETTISPIKDANGNISNFVSTAKDITDRFQYEQHLKYLAHHDTVTNLPNRTLFMDRLSRALVRAERIKQQVAVLFMDLDRFKIVNDTLGHDVGDKLLHSVATRLQQNVRKGDTIARLGGDEFALILEDIHQIDNVTSIVEKIIAAFNAPHVVDKKELSVSASIGVAMYPADGEDISGLLRHADIAMYRAKENGGNNYCFYSAKMSTQTSARLTLETSMRRALETGDEFLIHYQPQLNLNTGEVIGAEALVRWQHPRTGLIPPLDFIPLSEETGLIEPLGDLILNKACTQTKIWHDQGINNLTIAINVSGRQFRKQNFTGHIASILNKTGLDPSKLEIEITESVMMQDMPSTTKTLSALRDLGVQVSIDDFGTGYSSLAYLKKMPIDALKIDRTFVLDIIDDKDDAAIVHAITTMARTLGIKAVAEGVENREQLSLLRDYNCDIAQGFFLGRPMPVDDFSRYLQVFDIPARQKLNTIE